MKKENFLILTACLFLLAYVLDSFAGPVSITVKNHFSFLSSPILNKYPFTAVAVAVRTLGIFSSVLLVVSLIDEMYFAKAAGLFSLGALAELYTIQQLATGTRMTSIQWTLSIGFCGVLLIIPVIFYILRGLFSTVGKKLNKDESLPVDSNP